MFSPAPFNDVDNSQMKGNIDNNDTAIKIMWIGMFFKLSFIQVIIAENFSLSKGEGGEGVIQK